MIERREIPATSLEIVSKTCDKCKKTYLVEGEGEMEAQEFHHIYFTGGYDSIFGDMEAIECDLCQHCLYELIKDFYRVREQ